MKRVFFYRLFLCFFLMAGKTFGLLGLDGDESSGDSSDESSDKSEKAKKHNNGKAKKNKKSSPTTSTQATTTQATTTQATTTQATTTQATTTQATAQAEVSGDIDTQTQSSSSGSWDWSTFGSIGEKRAIAWGPFDDPCLTNSACLEVLSCAIDSVMAADQGLVRNRNLRGESPQDERHLFSRFDACYRRTGEGSFCYFMYGRRRRQRNLWWSSSSGSSWWDNLMDSDIKDFIDSGCWTNSWGSDDFKANVLAEMVALTAPGAVPFDTSFLELKLQKRYC